MIEITIAAADFAALETTLLGKEVEHCAVLFASQVDRADGLRRLLVSDVDVPSPADYTGQQFDAAELSPQYVAKVSKMARRASLSLIFAHSHPGGAAPMFSQADNAGEQLLSKFLAFRNPNNSHVALVLSQGGCRARRLGTDEEIRVTSIGEFRRIQFDPGGDSSYTAEIFDRQIRAFGPSGQRAVSGLRIGVVGLGGTGSIVVQQLAHLGTTKFVLIDPDIIDATNLNRVVGAGISDIGSDKTDIAARYIRSLTAGAELTCVKGDVTRVSAAQHLLNADFIFGCTDSHGSRAVLQQIAYQYLIPCVDVGSTITTEAGQITGIFGRVQMMSPDQACFNCSGLLDAAEVRRDMMSEFERRQDPYIVGAREPAPAVISLNGTVVSLAVTMFLSIVTGLPSRGRYLLYDARQSTLRAVRSNRQENCYICSKAGALAKGNSIDLYARQE
jgi:molybdopterin/thiamine biosynthesis adenylyltransferase